MTNAAGAVTASSSAAAEAGAAILRAGGNAVDAAVATALASCVADPCNTGLGGYGGHMVVSPPGEDPVCVDFNMWNPARARQSGYEGPRFGPQASAVPNVVAGLARALAEFGSMTWAELLAPALALAADGVEVNATTAAAFADAVGSDFLDECFDFAGEGAARRFRQPMLARTLDTMAKEGPGWFYDGPLGETGSAGLRRGGRETTPSDWADAPQAVTVAPAARLRLGDVTLFSAPLGTSGSISMFATFAAGARLAERQGLEGPDAVLDWARRLAGIWSYRFGVDGGNDVDQATVEAWIARALAFEEPRPVPAGSGHTCHLNTADGDGALVAVTLTHGPSWFGARWAVPGSGVIMNSGMHLLTGAAPKESGGRSYAVTNMSPTIARTDDGVRIAAGCPGARRIPTAVGLVLARHLLGDLTLQDAVSRGRFHAESHDLATLEQGRWSDTVEQALRAGFPRVGTEGPGDYYGPFTAIRRGPDGRVELGLDDRWRGYGATTA